MDKAKPNTAKIIHLPEVGADGLTKKQRKQQNQAKKENAVHVTEAAAASISNEAAAASISNETEKKSTVNGGDSSVQLTEKQRRKLEWEQKRAEQLKEQGDGEAAQPQLSKAQLKAQRREQQEAQRLAKAEASKAVPKAETKKPGANPEPAAAVAAAAAPVPKVELAQATAESTYPFEMVEWVSHLYPESPKKNLKAIKAGYIHSEFHKLGCQYKAKTLIGSTARCISFMEALRKLVNDIEIPPNQQFLRYFETIMSANVAHLNECRTLSVSIKNALERFNVNLQATADMQNDIERKDYLLQCIDNYRTDQIEKAGQAINLIINEKIDDNDVILIYGYSCAVLNVLETALKSGKKFEVIVIHGRPREESKEMLQKLMCQTRCHFADISALHHLIRSTTKVLLGAHALLTNGSIASRIGMAQVAESAERFKVPVLFCCEMFKFTERAQTDSFLYNELDKEVDVANLEIEDEENNAYVTSSVYGLLHNRQLRVLNMLYDLTPQEYITGVATELGLLPSISAPVVFRFKEFF